MFSRSSVKTIRNVILWGLSVLYYWISLACHQRDVGCFTGRTGFSLIDLLKKKLCAQSSFKEMHGCIDYYINEYAFGK